MSGDSHHRLKNAFSCIDILRKNRPGSIACRMKKQTFLLFVSMFFKYMFLICFNMFLNMFSVSKKGLMKRVCGHEMREKVC